VILAPQAADVPQSALLSRSSRTVSLLNGALSPSAPFAFSHAASERSDSCPPASRSRRRNPASLRLGETPLGSRSLQGGVESMYAHLSRIDVRVGDIVRTRERLGLVGATGGAAGPHLHFEVRVRGAAVDPLSGLK
jgi:hypothetical protein